MLRPTVSSLRPFLAASLLLVACVDPSEDSSPDLEPAGDVAELQSASACSEPEMFLTELEVTDSTVKLHVSGLCHKLDWTVRRRQGNGAPVPIQSGDTLPTTFVDTGLEPHTQYCYRAIAGNNGGSGNECATTTAGTPDAPVLSSDAASITLTSRDRSTFETGFEVQHRNVFTGAWEIERVVATPSKPGTGAPIGVVGLTPPHDESHCFRIAAIDAVSKSPSAETCTVYRNEGAAPAGSAVWSLVDLAGGKRIPQVRYHLRNLTVLLDLVVSGGLLWSDTLAAGNAFVERRFADSIAPVVEGELVAIFVDGGGYMVRNPSGSPHDITFQAARDASAFQWKLVRSGTASAEGQPVPQGAMALFNTLQNDFLVARNNPAIVELRWFREP